ncbi:cyclic nucleotide-binding domain-containing protein [Cyanobium sp. N5-Cardenillas]|uniref:cyclic nucleotide-binding domain-containing protein n=1 Tax=Cyanobium sp. N5-Cardenillas TaxID=2823720 RepID=UPI0020CC622D|nr:cyclic nucleotide-binding domain-containing protein [Cyanobium sp. N5-Cardenillas]MCP9786542.1 cyclic nucleotide-binding domain-containing protein [Cyanobium sp. N5-Cardenillas]
MPLFADLSPEELQQIALLFKEQDFEAGETLIEEGSGGSAFHVIEAGEATVAIQGTVRSRLGAGDFFGEIALIDDGTRMATITAATRLDGYGLTYGDFRPLVEANGVIGWKLLQRMARLLRDARRG